MERIYSNVKPELITHIIHKKYEMADGRKDLIDADNFLQCASLNMTRGQTFKPHKHIIRPEVLLSDYNAQEAWVIIMGDVSIVMYDINNKELGTRILGEGDCVITLNGGHNYMALDYNTLVYEFKTGPYLGQELDKEFI